ncbi:hypothetical protein HMPREF0444_1423 [Granulicatella adiacens ATCC 49175]|uniref:Uncharacterized protein n=1 Tax=Granulicatella adiacens ATCC 49175 TaxID=638301 RepID=C8NHM8_9LACT|nr:hypothetical protein HMPREF0444_1423 [Granulicatella adiacens ATCC 49175]
MQRECACYVLWRREEEDMKCVLVMDADRENAGAEKGQRKNG